MKMSIQKPFFSFTHFYGWLLCAILFVLFFTNLKGQAPSILWQKTLGGTNYEQAKSIQQTTDGGYIVAGYTASSNFGDIGSNHGGGDVSVLKLDNAGLVQWQKTLGGTGNDGANSIQQTKDGGYIVAGYTSSSNTGDVGTNHGGWDIWILKLDNTGVIQWQKTFGGTEYDEAYFIQQTKDDGYIVAGETYSSNTGDVGSNHGDGGNDVWVLKLDNTGVILWQKMLGGAYYDSANSIQQTTDGGYIVAGYTSSSNTGFNDFDAWVLKLDNIGLVQWQKTLGGTSGDLANSIQQTADGGYIVAGYTASSNSGDIGTNHGGGDVSVLKLDNTGLVQWQKTLGGTGEDGANSIQQTKDGGYIVAGFTTSSNSGDVGTNHGGWDVLVLKLDSTGLVQWQKTLGGTENEDRATSILQTTDGNYIVACCTPSSNSGDVGTNHGGYDIWVVKLVSSCLFTSSITANSFFIKDSPLTLTGSATTGTAVWSSDNPSVATVSQTGVVTGVTKGIARISYAVTQGGCTAVVIKDITVVYSLDPTKCYRITNKTTGKALAVKNASLLDSAQIYQWTFDGRMDKLWKVVKFADGKYNFVSVGSGKLMDVQDNTSAGFCTEGTIIQQFRADGTSSQKWRLELQETDGTFKILNATCNKFLRVEGPSSADGANVGIKNDFGTDAFKWFIEEAPCTTPIYSNQCYRIVNKATNKVLELKNGALTDSTQIYQWASATNRPQQLWQTTKLSDGKYIITSASSQKVIDVLDNTASGFCTEGTIIQQFPLDLTNSQRWGIIAQTDGSYKIVNTTCNKYLRVESGSTADGASVGIKNDFGSDAFKWYFQPADCSTGAVLSATNAIFNFEARASEGRAKLQWLTNTGDKTDYFTVERLNPQGDFAILDRQNAYPTKDTKYYTFIDNDPLDGDNFYRINTVFNNAPPQYSEVKKVDFSKNDGVNIYPNPANDYISVDLRKYEGKTVSLYLYNAMGLMVKKQIIEKVSAVPQRIDIDEFITGSYLVRVQAEGKRDVLRQVTIAK